MIGPDKGILPQAKELVKELDLEDSVDFIGPVASEKFGLLSKSRGLLEYYFLRKFWNSGSRSGSHRTSNSIYQSR